MKEVQPKEWNSVSSTRYPLCKERIEKNPWDHEGWMEFVKVGKMDGNQECFQLATNQFPTFVPFWLDWLDFCRSRKDLDSIELVFQKCIKLVPSLALYREYVNYIKTVHSPNAAPDHDERLKAQQTITSTYDYCLNVVGTDKDSGSMWLDYIRFVKDMQTASSYEEQQQMDQLRKIFLKAVQLPLYNVEEIWKEYDAFENQLSKLTAKKFISDQAGGYMTARGAFKELVSLLEPIDRVSASWIPKPPTWTPTQVQLLNCWKRYLSWERSNPLNLQDRNVFMSRVAYAYKSCLLMLRHFPEIWVDYASFLVECKAMDESLAVLQQAVEANPSSLLLNFTLAESLESNKVEFADIQKLFDGLLSTLEAKFVYVMAEYDQQRDSLFAYLKDTITLQLDDLDEGERRERERELKKEHEREVHSRVETVRQKEILLLKKSITLTWIVYMRLTRRSQSIRAARVVFSKARKHNLITSHVFIASGMNRLILALMEYYINKDAIVAGKIFEVGLKAFPMDKDKEATGYVLQYLDFLISLNDDNNTRALYERALQSIPSEDAVPIWKKYIDYETQYGDLTNLYQVQKRYAAVYPSKDANTLDHVDKLASQWSYFDIDIVGTVELGQHALKNHPRMPAPSTGKTSVGMLAHLGERKDGGVLPVIMVGGINADKYPKPDFASWHIYKAEGGKAKVAPIISNDSFQEDEPVIPHKRQEPAALTGTILVPEQIAKLMANLPRKEAFKGPIVHVKELIQVLVNMPIPPLKTPKYVPAPIGVSDKTNSRKRGRFD